MEVNFRKARNRGGEVQARFAASGGTYVEFCKEGLEAETDGAVSGRECGTRGMDTVALVPGCCRERSMLLLPQGTQGHTSSLKAGKIRKLIVERELQVLTDNMARRASPSSVFAGSSYEGADRREHGRCCSVTLE